MDRDKELLRLLELACESSEAHTRLMKRAVLYSSTPPWYYEAKRQIRWHRFIHTGIGGKDVRGTK